MTPVVSPEPSPAAPRLQRRLQFRLQRRWLRGSARAVPALVLVLVSVLGLVAGCGTIDREQRRWIFQPSERSWAGASWAAEGMQEVWIPFQSRESGSAVRLHGLWLPQADPAAPVMLYLHGARWDVRSSAPRMRRMHELGFSILGIDYRGFGQSTPELPSETLAAEDAQAAWAWLADKRPGARRFLFGHSLGGALAVRVATTAPGLAGLIVEGSFTSIADVFSTFKWGWLPVSAFITQRFDAAEQIAAVKAPVLVVHGSEDTLIKPALGRALFERAREPKRFVLVEGGSHHNTNAVGLDLYRRAIDDLFGLVPPAGEAR